MFLAVSTNIGDPTPHLEAEGLRMQELQRDGLVDQVFLKADWSGAVVLLSCADAATAREAVESLPLARNGLTTFELTELIPAPGM